MGVPRDLVCEENESSSLDDNEVNVIVLSYMRIDLICDTPQEYESVTGAKIILEVPVFFKISTLRGKLMPSNSVVEGGINGPFKFLRV